MQALAKPVYARLMVQTIRILGIDPGLGVTGWGVIDQTGTRLSLVAHGVIKTPVKSPLPQRLEAIFAAVEALVAEYAPGEAAVEDQFVSANAGTALKLGQARAAAILPAARAGLTVAEYAPRLVKKSVVGTGAADKTQVAAMMSVILPGSRAVADAADALAVAVCHAHHRGSIAKVSA
ncbi:MAG: crossover junction endodeoxyribonuclease RuvC [Oceanicaulis sp. HLUCCA04]|nr:MAG: crossover junction endodeoxyribonuclease RuvC [Oceanicaulis sp. HLUCCA04]